MSTLLTSKSPSASSPNPPRFNCLHQAYQSILNISFRHHIFASILLRIVLICYGQYHDAHSEVPYTDIDYKVVTDGARHIQSGQTPFNRHTYRYSPILAYMQLPNLWWHAACGKFIYAAFDIFVALLIYALVRAELHSQCRKAVQYLLNKMGKADTTSSSTGSSSSTTKKNYQETDARNRPERIACASACFWLYNPLTAVISTRGNGDSFASFFVILTIYLLARAEDSQQRSSRWLVFAAGLAHGFAIHLRLYPLLFSLAYFLSLSSNLTNSFGCFLRQLVLPSSKQLLLILGTLLSLVSVTGYFYYLYGWQYLYEAYFYHFIRKDARHNFSLYFLMQYLSSSPENSSLDNLLLEKLLIQAAQFFLLLYLSFSFGQFRQTLPFCIFSLAFVMVTFNSVVTSQYFIWYLSLLPLCLNNLTSLSLLKACGYFALWLLAQGGWLLPAYLLEFKSWNSFYWLGAQSAVFFLVNNFILAQLIKHYSFTSFKVNFKKLF